MMDRLLLDEEDSERDGGWRALLILIHGNTKTITNSFSIEKQFLMVSE